MVRECVFKEHLGKPLTVKLLDASRDYWKRKGIRDWGIVIDDTSLLNWASASLANDSLVSVSIEPHPFVALPINKNFLVLS